MKYSSMPKLREWVVGFEQRRHSAVCRRRPPWIKNACDDLER